MHYLRKINFSRSISCFAFFVLIAISGFGLNSAFAQSTLDQSSQASEVKGSIISETPATTDSAANDASEDTESSAVFTEIKPVKIDGYSLSLSTKIDLILDNELKQALSKGLPLYFTLDARIYQKRRYWLDKIVSEQSLTWMIHYNVLLREWRIERGQYYAKGFSLEDALSLITTNDEWLILLNEPMNPAKTYYGEVRLRLDTSLLSRPFQISAFSDTSAWSFSSSWKKFEIHH